MKNIVICGNYGATNIGDELILAGILTSVRERYPDARITVMCADTKRVQAMHYVDTVPLLPFGVRSFFRSAITFSWIKTVRAVKQCDLFIFGGGGLFTDEIFRAPILWAYQASLAHRFKRHIVIYGQSFGPLKTKIGQRLARKVCEWADVITVRDQESQDLLYALGVDKKIQVVADPALILDMEKYAVSLPARKERYMLIVLRSWIFGNEVLSKKIAQLIIDMSKKHGFKTILIPFQNTEDDELLNKKIIQELDILAPDVADDTIQLPYTDDIRTLSVLFRDAALVVGMRLHSLILALLTDTPSLGIIYSQKVCNFLVQSEQVENSITLEDICDNQYAAEVLEKMAFATIKNAPQLVDTRRKVKNSLTEAAKLGSRSL